MPRPSQCPFTCPQSMSLLIRLVAEVISKIDLTKGFHQIPVAEQDRDKTTFVCPMGKFCYMRMPSGLRNGLAVFQQLMDKTLDGCHEFAKPYIDDVVIFSQSWQEHLLHIDKVLEALDGCLV